MVRVVVYVCVWVVEASEDTMTSVEVSVSGISNAESEAPGCILLNHAQDLVLSNKKRPTAGQAKSRSSFLAFVARA